MNSIPVKEEDGDNTEPIEYFEQSLTSIFGDVNGMTTTEMSHGDPGKIYHYIGITCTLALRMTVVDSWEEQMKFSHYIWEAGLYLARHIEKGDIHVRNRRVLELGAGAGLCGILAALQGASEVVLSDYPAQSMLKNLEFNVNNTIPDGQRNNVHIVGHLWGADVEPLLETGTKGLFDTILVGDCLWMPEQHDALCRTLAGSLKKDHGARIHIVAGFHSGRRKMAPFFDKLEGHDFVPQHATFEHCFDGSQRVWSADRPEEDSVERKKWLVVAEYAWSSRCLLDLC